MMMWNNLLQKTILGFLAMTAFLAVSSALGREPTFNSQALQFFPHSIYGATPQTHDDMMGDLIDVTRPGLNFPPFPRTWLELGLSRSESTSTSWIFGMSKTLDPANILQIGGRATFETDYSYEVSTTFIAISSLRPIDSSQSSNTHSSFGVLPTTQPPAGGLRSIIHWEEAESRTYFRSNQEYPVIGLCKFEMKLRVATSQSTSVRFLVYEDQRSDEEAETITYAMYSNFFAIDNDMPIQDYLRIKCREEFSFKARFVAEVEFYNVVREVFAHYHPRAQCTLPAGKEPLDPRGDATCMNWYRNPRYVMGSYRRTNVPRCVLGSEGIPVCVLRAKENGTCPVYLEKGRLSTNRTSRASLVTAGDYHHFPCDSGMSCQPADGGTLQDFDVRWFLRWTGADFRCRRR